jgi:hypothetical protein
MKKLLGILGAVTVVIAAGAVILIKPKILATAEIVPAPPSVAFSIDDLQRQIDMRALPVMEIKDLN